MAEKECIIRNNALGPGWATAQATGLRAGDRGWEVLAFGGFWGFFKDTNLSTYICVINVLAISLISFLDNIQCSALCPDFELTKLEGSVLLGLQSNLTP